MSLYEIGCKIIFASGYILIGYCVLIIVLAFTYPNEQHSKRSKPK